MLFINNIVMSKIQIQVASRITTHVTKILFSRRCRSFAWLVGMRNKSCNYMLFCFNFIRDKSSSLTIKISSMRNFARVSSAWFYPSWAEKNSNLTIINFLSTILFVELGHHLFKIQNSFYCRK